jgi:hypothetical protein
MRRASFVFAFMLALTLVGGLLLAPAHAAERYGPSVVVSPDAGTQYQTFDFTGTGPAPGTLIYPAMISPDGEEYDFHVLVAGNDGTFYMQVSPVNDFAGASYGVWQAYFTTDSGLQAEVDFTVSPYNLDQPSG